MSAGTQVVRKSAYGRTRLFLPSTESTLLRELRSSGGIVRRDTASAYHTLPEAYGTESEGSACWHCCDPIPPGHLVVPLPRLYDADTRVYYVYGRTCSAECAKAYVLEHTTFDRGQHLNTLTRMLRDLYGITHAVTETPPRPALKRFGGPFDPRCLPKTAKTCRLVEPPFVSYCMIVEEQGAVASSTEVEVGVRPSTIAETDELVEPHPPALFDAFVQETAEGRTAAPPPPKRAKSNSTAKNRASCKRPNGPMSRFMKE